MVGMLKSGELKSGELQSGELQLMTLWVHVTTSASAETHVLHAVLRSRELGAESVSSIEKDLGHGQGLRMED